MDVKKALADALSFMEEAGILAVENQNKAACQIKADDTLVTETDLAITEMAYEHFGDWFKQPNHILIDEESIDKIGTPEQIFANSDFQWLLDPIDGTMPYANGRPSYGIFLAIVHKGFPVLSVIYQPAQDLLIYGTSGKGVVKVKNPFTPQAEMIPIEKYQLKEFTSQSMFDISRSYLIQGGWRKIFYGNTQECTLQGGVRLVQGQSSGLLTSDKCSIWDVVPIWCLVKMLGGGEVYNFSTKEIINQIDASWFQEDWKVRSGWLFAPEKALDIMHDYLNEVMNEEAA
ncbi:MAG: hypothetical protein OXR68_06575 [Alphaproteobacteria bacterium]|nr:hypothetical protein [Alphaproteobacteria bacterium]MDD9920268.1 hypothetical protein [Alphaproteobacteria bacterium]